MNHPPAARASRPAPARLTRPNPPAARPPADSIARPASTAAAAGASARTPWARFQVHDADPSALYRKVGPRYGTMPPHAPTSSVRSPTIRKLLVRTFGWAPAWTCASGTGTAVSYAALIGASFVADVRAARWRGVKTHHSLRAAACVITRRGGGKNAWWVGNEHVGPPRTGVATPPRVEFQQRAVAPRDSR